MLFCSTPWSGFLERPCVGAPFFVRIPTERTAMPATWYYTQADKATGPVSSAQLKALATSGQLQPTDKVRKEDMHKWVLASQVKGLFPISTHPQPQSSADEAATGHHGSRSWEDCVAAEATEPTSPADETSAVAGSSVSTQPTGNPFADDVRRISDRLTAYAEDVPHHDIDNFGSIIRITAVGTIPIFSIDLDTHYEARECVAGEKPYEGWPIAPLAVTQDNVDVWAYDLSVPSGFAQTTTDTLIDASQQVYSCGECNANGIVTCPQCDGGRVVTCPQCDGACSQVSRCSECGGQGQVNLGRRIQRRRKCYCTGGRVQDYRSGHHDEWVVHSVCNGTGEQLYDDMEPYFVNCPVCRGRGEIDVRCSTCNGNGQLRCSTCSGQGQLTCPKCEGHKKLVFFLVVRQVFTATKDSSRVPAFPCPASAVQLLTPADFALLARKSSTELAAQDAINTQYDALAENIDYFLTTARTRLSEAQRICNQSLQVREGSVHHVLYQYHKDSYELWVVGKDMQVYAPASPVTEYAQSRVEEALRLWDAGSTFKATSPLLIAEEMGKSDVNCQMVLDRMAGRIPVGLKTGTKLNWFFTKSMAWPILAGCLLFAGVMLVFVLVFSRRGSTNEADAERNDGRTAQVPSLRPSPAATDDEKRDREALEAQQRDKERKERAEREAVELERERQTAIERERQREASKREQPAIDPEKQRKEDLEARGLAYYPSPRTVYGGRNAEQWYQLAQANPQNARIQKQATSALVTLRAEGVPFLLDALQKVSVSPQATGVVLPLVAPQYIHYNDLPKIIACLDGQRYPVAIRMTALRMLGANKESKRYSALIQVAVSDLQATQYKRTIEAILQAIGN